MSDSARDSSADTRRSREPIAMTTTEKRTGWLAVVTALRTALDALEALGGPIVQSRDELGTIARFAAEWQVEEKGLATAAHRHRLQRVKLGRSWAYRRSDLLALVDLIGHGNVAALPATPESGYRDLVARKRRAA